MPLRVAFLTTTLDFGGAETVLFHLIRAIDRKQFSPSVICLMDQGRLGTQIQALGVPVHALGLRQGQLGPRAVLRLIRFIKEQRPDVIQGWMYHGNAAAQLVRLFKQIPIVWCIHNSFLSFASERPMTRLVVRLLAAVSGSPAAIVYVSRAGRTQHEALGFARERGAVIPNGVDSALFKPDLTARESVRRELGLSSDTPLVGLMARLHPQKDHANFFKAASIIAATQPEVHFVLAGAQIDSTNPSLKSMINRFSLEGRVRLLGPRRDMPRLNAAMDIATSSSSYGEALSIALLEAMSCGVPCVTTDVGDNAVAVGETGITVAVRDPRALAAAWHELLASAEERRRLGEAARRRVESQYSIARCAERYEELYIAVASR